jgi:tetratricopeptide (TPR) repeat protein
VQRYGAGGYLMRDGEFIAFENVERMTAVAAEFLKSPKEIAGFLLELARECDARGSFAAAREYFEKASRSAATDAAKAYCLLGAGQVSEQLQDYAGAVERYARALRTHPKDGDMSYLLHNNTGYCLNQLGRHREAEKACRTAIRIDPRRHNAHKNLGVALERLGRHAEAAASWLTAAENCPEDPRALRLLEELVLSHPDVLDQVPDFRSRLDACRGHDGAGLN